MWIRSNNASCNEKFTATLENSLAISYKIKHSIHPRKPTAEVLSEVMSIHAREVKTCARMKTCTWKLNCLPNVATNEHKLADLKQQTFILFQFQRPEVHNQGVHRARLSLKFLRDNLFRGSPLVPGPRQFLARKSITPISVSAITRLSPSVSVSVSSLLKTPILLDQGSS